MELIKRLSIVLLSLLSIISCSKVKKINSWQEMNLKGRVKSIKEIAYDLARDSKSIEKGELFSTSKFLFNEEGNFIEKALYDARDTLVFQHYYKSNKGLIIECVSEQIDRGRFKYVFRYDTQGAIQACLVYNSKGLLSFRIQCKGDDNGRPIEQIKYDANDKLIDRVKIVYDKDGHMIEKALLAPDNSLELKFLYEYDNKGNLIKEEKSNSENRIIASHSYQHKFDQKGNWLQKIEYTNSIPRRIYTREIEYYE